ncbi:MAG: LytTR family transcriptional regulator DNA-binding domain-containing protein [Lachnospiraceae bacterium]|nr:LytTR family transcriptional regulator DNA-binding domain-containing protein [Lachnospiraceae bacterium]
MLHVLLCSGNTEELNMIYSLTKEQAAYKSEDKWNIDKCSSSKEIMRQLQLDTLLDGVCVDITIQDGIRAVEEIRKKNKKAYIILIATPQISPLEYIKPTIMASGLVLRPIDQKLYKDSIEQMLITFANEPETSEDLLVLENREGRNRIPYDSILYFEAREKKIFACTNSGDYGFYETLDNMLEKIPDYFVRCHRSFIVNTRKIKKIIMVDNMIFLTDDLIVPISRSYRNAVKEYR